MGVAIALALQLLAMFWSALRGVLETSPVAIGTLWSCLAATASTVVVTFIPKLVTMTREGYTLGRLRADAIAAAPFGKLDLSFPGLQVRR